MNAPLALAFTAGLVATVNPCGFAMLPAYLSYFLGVGNTAETTDSRTGLIRALYIGSAVSAGVIATFLAVGVLISAGVNGIRDVIPWVTIVIGFGLIGLGIAMLRGFRLTVAVPKIEKGADGKGVRSLLLFGVSYAVASLSCSIGVFLALVFSATDGFVSGLTAFLFYGLGFALVLMALTVSLATAQRGVVGFLRRAMQHVDRAAGVLLIIAGAYTIWFWVIDLTADTGDQPGPIRWVERQSSRLTTWVDNIGGVRIGMIFALIVVLALFWILARPARPDQKESVSAR